MKALWIILVITLLAGIGFITFKDINIPSTLVKEVIRLDERVPSPSGV